MATATADVNKLAPALLDALRPGRGVVGVNRPDGTVDVVLVGKVGGKHGSGVRSGLLCWKFCASTATAPLWGRSEVGEGGFLLLELRQVRGELDDQ